MIITCLKGVSTLLKLSVLKPFTFYRSKSPIVLPIDVRKPQRNALFTVLAPTSLDALRWAADSDNVVRFRNVAYYFIPRFFEGKLFGTSAIRRNPGEEMKIAEYLEELKAENGQFDKINFVSYKANMKTNYIKGYNVFYDASYLIQLVLENSKDHRLLAKKMEDLGPMLTAHLHGDRKLYHMDGYSINTLIIPVNLWSDNINDLNIFKKTSKDNLGQFVNLFATNEAFKNMFHGYRVLLVNHNEIMVLDPELIPDDAKEGYIFNLIKMFLKRCKSTESRIEVEADSPEEAEEIAQAENVSKRENTTEKVIKAVVPDKATVSKETVKKIAAAVAASAAAPKGAKGATPKIRVVPVVPEDGKVKDVIVEPEKVAVANPEEEPANEKKLSAAQIITQARLSGQSIGNYQRNELLKERYKDLQIDNCPIQEVIKSEEKYVIPKKKIKANTINPAYKELRAYNFEKAYNDKLFMHDLARILLHFSKCDPALYLLNDPEIEDISTDIDKLYLVTVEYEDENRRRHKFKFRLPKMYQDRYLFLSEQKWNIIHQKTPFPVTKIGPDRAQVVSNYNKIMMERYGQNVSAKITKLKKILEGANCPRSVKPIRGDVTRLNKAHLTTIEFDELGSKFNKITVDGTSIYFAVDDALAVIPPHTMKSDNTLYPIAANRRAEKYYYLSGATNHVYDADDKDLGELSDWLVDLIAEKHPDFKDQFDDVSAGTKFMYVRGKISGTWMPLILIMCAADPGGLTAVMDKAKLNYQFTPSRPRNLDTNNKGVIAFTDGYLIYDRYPYENSLLMNGLSVIPSKTYSYYDMGNRDTYVEIFDLLYKRRNLIDGIESFYYLEIDPITEDVLSHLGMPTEFTSLLLYANGIMADNSYAMDSAYEQCRLRSNEIVMARLYDLLAKAYELFKTKDEKFSIKENALIKALLEERIVDPHSKLNIALELEGDNQVKLKGPHGMNEERSFTLEKRAYHPSMQGIIGMNSAYSGEAGINRHMSLNSNVIDARGFVQPNKKEYDGTELETPAELLNPFDVESSDPERVAMAISQAKHCVPVVDSQPSLVSYDMERVAPYMSNDYTTVSKKPGVVKEIANDVMIVQYDDGTYQDVDLGESPNKNTDGGFYIMNKQITDLKVGDRFEADQIIAYDPKAIAEKDMFGDYLSDTGTLARVAIVSNGAVYEDATYLTDDLAERMSTYITIDKTVHLSRFSNVKKIVKKGQHVQANEPILYFEEADDIFSSQMLQQIAEESEDEDEITASMAPVFSKVTGVIKDIKIYYTCDIDEMSPSLQKLIKSYNAEVSKRHKTIEKYIDPRDAQTIVPPCEKVVPDSTGRVKGKKMPKDIMIEFYIEYRDKMSGGDKMSNMYALKGVCCDIIPKGLEGFTEFNPERKIDAYLSAFGLFKRMVFSLEKTGALTKILIEKKRLMKNKYLDRINEELKKK